MVFKNKSVNGQPSIGSSFEKNLVISQPRYIPVFSLKASFILEKIFQVFFNPCPPEPGYTLPLQTV